jgi:hypothetical protein
LFGNGLIGLRVREVPLLPGATILNGAGLHRDNPVEAAIPVPYPLAGDVGIAEAWLSEQPWSISDMEQRYDFYHGELSSRFSFHQGELTLKVEVLTFASRSDPALVLQEVGLSANKPCQIRVRAAIATKNVRGHAEERETGVKAEKHDGAMLWIPKGGMSCCGIAFHSQCAAASGEPEFRERHGSGPLVTEYKVDLKPGKAAHLEQIAGLIPSVAHSGSLWENPSRPIVCMARERWPGLPEQGLATSKWIVCRLFQLMPISGVMQGGRSPTGVTPDIGGQTHAAIIMGRLSK